VNGELMMRKQTNIQIIHNITFIQNADSIEEMSALGWKVVVKRDSSKTKT
jgi:hypothetical protein